MNYNLKYDECYQRCEDKSTNPITNTKHKRIQVKG
uniref:Uncharacterized protein n=1 Tax=Arundo donax TaxID=35708 RepID=A0A0A9BG53_ARUDO